MNLCIVCADATKITLPGSDLIYVNVGVAAPTVSWLQSLRPQGRMIFPWRPSESIGLTMLVKRRYSGLNVKPLMPSWFIPCVVASDTVRCLKAPDIDEARSVRSVWISSERPPDDTAAAIFGNVWFFSSALS